jgi:CubicO group peptidase (beta-lactamase class C family)
VVPDATYDAIPTVLDSAVAKLMMENHVPGAAVAVVHRDKVIYLKGFGEPVVGGGASVSPSTTTFRIGSVSKLFTAIAALQLAEASKLDFGRNVSDYSLPFSIDYPTTMHQLLTHTAGFDERLAGAYTDTPPLPRLSDHLRLAQPRQVFEPGTAYSYSNYNYAVAGAVIERASSQRFEDYLADHVLKPLRMEATTAYQPPPSAGATTLRAAENTHERSSLRSSLAR